MELQKLIEAWNGFAVVSQFDHATGTWIFIALHDRTLGRPTGGTRVRVYGSPAEGLHDAMHLAEGMTHKWAAADLPYGGGKAVLAIPGPLRGEAREGLLRRYGRLLESLRGGFATGEDLGTTPQDMAIIGEETEYVIGVSDNGSMTDPGPFTARGVLAALRAAVRAAYGDEDLAGRRVLIQGLGDVGTPLARHLADAGAHLLLCDTDAERVERIRDELATDNGSPETVAPGALFDTPCDVFAPCAVGFVLSEETVPRLRCRVVAGSANNQLASPKAADLLHERGIVYAPDYIANGGGAIAFGMMEQGVDDREILFARIDKIGDALDEIFEEAGDRDESPLHAAHRRVERILEREAGEGGS
jgi:leucine dehydrogenase